MKKISLVLCACAVAMAGLLASCSNGPEELVFNTVEDTWETSVLYDVSGSFKKVEKVGAKDSVATTECAETITSGYSVLAWESKTPNVSDVITYDFRDAGLKVKRVDTVTPSSGTATTTTYSEQSENFWWPNIWNRGLQYATDKGGFVRRGSIYSAKFHDMNWQYKDETLTLSADPATSDSFTLTFNFFFEPI